MALKFSFSPLRPWVARLPELVGRLGQWWLKEFLALFPGRIAEWLVGRGRSSLVLAPRRGAVDLQLLSDSRQPLARARIALADFSPAAIDLFLRTHELERNDVAIGIRLPAEKFFTRTLVLPIEAARSINRIAAQDLAGKTPFKLDDIYHDHVASRSAGADKIVVRQWVTRRDFVNDTLASLDMELASVAFADAEGEPDGDAPPPLIALGPDRGARGSGLRKTAWALGICAVLLGAAAGGLRYWRQQSILEGLDAQVTSAKVKAQTVRAAIDKLELKQAVLLQLRSQKADRPRLLDAWEEATRVLPSHSWLTELRLTEMPDKQEQQVAMIGFSAAAPSLVALVDQSPLFTDASLTAPISLDPVEQRERFALQAKLRRQGQLKQASR